MPLSELLGTPSIMLSQVEEIVSPQFTKPISCQYVFARPESSLKVAKENVRRNVLVSLSRSLEGLSGC